MDKGHFGLYISEWHLYADSADLTAGAGSRLAGCDGPGLPTYVYGFWGILDSGDTLFISFGILKTPHLSLNLDPGFEVECSLQ
jgi:hypothetical protein